MQDQESTPAPPPFQLPKSGLTLHGTRLTRRMEKGEVVAEFELSEMSAIEFTSQRDPALTVLGLAFAAVVVALAFFYWMSVWAWIGAGLTACLAAAFFIGSRQHLLVFAVGKIRLEFQILDSVDDGRAFVLMLQQTRRKLRS